MQLSQRIVVIDDERSVRSGLTNLLQSEGYLTNAFESAESLLGDEAAIASAALFIIDVQLKGMNGFELFINLTQRIENPPGIIISGNGDDTICCASPFSHTTVRDLEKHCIFVLTDHD